MSKMRDFPNVAALLRARADYWQVLTADFDERCEEVLGADGVDEADLVACENFLILMTPSVFVEVAHDTEHAEFYLSKGPTKDGVNLLTGLLTDVLGEP